jgi:hypothetical protein
MPWVIRQIQIGICSIRKNGSKLNVEITLHRAELAFKSNLAGSFVLIHPVCFFSCCQCLNNTYEKDGANAR